MRILIADAQPKVRFALRVLLERQHDMEVVGEAVDASSLLGQTKRLCPDLVLLGLELPDMALERLVPALREDCPGLLLIALSGQLGARHAAAKVGADAFVSKSSPPERLLAAIADCECRHQQQATATDAQD